MAIFEHDGASISYQVHGRGWPLLLFAPGGMNSIARLWRESPRTPSQPPPWIDPTTVLSDDFLVVDMDQRNAGSSSGPVNAGDGWATYAADHLGLMDHLGLDRAHLMGGCIGSSYCLGVCQAAPGRVTAAVLQNPIGLTADNRQAFVDMFDGWARDLRARRPDVTGEAIGALGEAMFGGDFVFSVDRDFVRRCEVPLLVLAGNDHFHPRAVAEEIVELAPSAELVLEWAGPEHGAATGERVRDFLASHTPRE